MQFPPEMIPVKKWYAFKAKLPPGSGNKHRVIVVYKYMNTVKYLYVTSQIEQARKLAQHDKGSIVRLMPSDWDALTKESCIQCDKRHLYEISEREFRQVCASEGYEYYGEIPQKIKDSIIYAICMSKTFNEAEKAVYTT